MSNILCFRTPQVDPAEDFPKRGKLDRSKGELGNFSTWLIMKISSGAFTSNTTDVE